VTSGLGLAALLLVAPPPALELRRVADGVFAVLQPAERRFDDSNATIVLTDDGVLVVDAQNSPAAARAVIARVREVTDKPVRYLVNTHWHGDHVHGNRAYREAFPGVLIVAQRLTREDIQARAVPELKQQLEELPGTLAGWEQALATGRTAAGVALTEAQQAQLRGRTERTRANLEQLRTVGELVLPDLTFEESLTLHRRAGEVRLLHYPGHTRGDVVLFLPHERVLVTGDLLDDLPFTGHGTPAGLVRTLDALSALDWQVMIPGHGAVRQGREHLQQVRALFASIVQQAQDGAKAGLSEDDTVTRVNLDAFEKTFVTDEVARRYWGFFMVEAVRQAYREAHQAR
jgi:cyclase